MSNPTAVDVALAFTKAWTDHDLQTAARFVAEDVVFDGPLGHITTKAAYLEGLAGLSRATTGVKVLAAFGEGDRALIMYELTTAAWGTLRCAKLLTVKDGAITSDTLAFDSHGMRQARDAKK